MRYPNIPKDKRNDVITMHIVETTEKVTSYYTVVGLNKKESIEAVENDGYYESLISIDDNWVNVYPDDDHREYGQMSKPKISDTKHYIPCVNHSEIMYKAMKGFPTNPSQYKCKQIMEIPKHVLDEAKGVYVVTDKATWIRQNPVCYECRRKIKQGYALKLEVVE